MKRIDHVKQKLFCEVLSCKTSGLQRIVTIPVMVGLLYFSLGLTEAGAVSAGKGSGKSLNFYVDDPVLSDNLIVDQQGRVSGTVTDENGNPMPGVNIQVEGTTIGSITDVSGRYTINTAAQDVVLVFSFIGYNTEKVNTAGRATVDVKMTSAVSALDEVIVIGYGTQKKSDLTGSVVRVTMEDKATMSNINVSQALVGATAGVNLEGRGS